MNKPSTVYQRFGIGIFFLLLSAASSQAATYFVRSGASGNGTSWANAWGNLSSIGWSSLAPDDVVCIAGGNYSSDLSTGKSGTSGHPIVVKRAVASDAKCGSSTAGWNAGYDSQIVMATGATMSLQNDFVTIDGMTWHGIKISIPVPPSGYAGGNLVGIGVGGPTNGITLAHIEVAGPCGSNGCAMGGAADPRSINLNRWNGSTYDLQNNMVIQYNDLHGACNGIWSAHSSNLIIEHSRIADLIELNPWPDNCHENVFITQDTTFVFRYNEVTNWDVEGILACPSGPCNSTMSGDIYGNIFHDAAGGNARIIETQYGLGGPYHFYNNTVANLNQPNLQCFSYVCDGTNCTGPQTSIYAPGTSSLNNVFVNDKFASCSGGIPNITEDYDYSDKALSEAHGQGSAANPFVNLAGLDFHLARATNAGQSLPSPYNIDPDGNLRGGDGVFDRGAYEFGGTIAPPPPPPPSDTQAPTVPTGLSASAVSSSQINLTWNASTDNVGVTGYKITRNGAQVGTSVSTSYSDTGLTGSMLYTYTVSAYDAAGNNSASSAAASATTPAGPPPPPPPPPPTSGQTLLTTQVPAMTGLNDGVAYELGARLQSNVAGQITAIRFWKDASETGTHTGHLWSASGSLLATVIFTNETASGWQQQSLSIPLTVTANTEYLVSVNTGNTFYVATTGGLASQIVSGNLSSMVGTNGRYGPMGSYPTQSFSNSNYFRDVVFAPASGAHVLTQPAGSVRVFPNPWKVRQHAGHPIIFDGLNAGSAIKIFTIDARLVKTIPDAAFQARWDLKNDQGDPVASGIYIYLITNDKQPPARGKLVIVH
jgi:chitodextrinase